MINYKNLTKQKLKYQNRNTQLELPKKYQPIYKTHHSNVKIYQMACYQLGTRTDQSYASQRQYISWLYAHREWRMLNGKQQQMTWGPMDTGHLQLHPGISKMEFTVHLIISNWELVDQIIFQVIGILNTNISIRVKNLMTAMAVN